MPSLSYVKHQARCKIHHSNTKLTQSRGRCPRACFKFVECRRRRSEDKNSGQHHQHSSPDAEHQDLAGDALEITRSRALVVLHDHGPSLLRPCQRSIRSAPCLRGKFMATWHYGLFVRIAGRRLSGRHFVLRTSPRCRISHRIYGHQTYETSDV